ncbi:hypothetical protein PR202_ga30299 [Eleusine coracana subsp. coracana]|uniref:DUF295 domain-containing protein n=1 Tax=Eleusine coracana subsp. coracana TaxID=191504 RepID=A0AAV5DQ93_ELECO|nr:hypothetical protein PR202_ga30299 [Eleusine coracana subsp. coracana]
MVRAQAAPRARMDALATRRGGGVKRLGTGRALGVPTREHATPICLRANCVYFTDDDQWMSWANTARKTGTWGFTASRTAQ